MMQPMTDQSEVDAILSGPFSMQVVDVFSIKRRGTVVTGQVASGLIRVGDPLMIESATRPPVATSCNGVEMFRKKLDQATKGDNVGLLLDAIEDGQVAQGDWLRAKSW
jgi:elongation factor Tu